MAKKQRKLPLFYQGASLTSFKPDTAMYRIDPAAAADEQARFMEMLLNQGDYRE